MTPTVLKWQVEKLAHTPAGARSLAVLATWPACMLIPWTSVGFFAEMLQATLVISTIYVLIVALTLGADAGRHRNTTFWLFQKNIDLAEYASAEWLAGAALGCACVIYATSWHVLAMAFRAGVRPTPLFVVLGVSLILLMVIQATLFLLNSAGFARSAEAVIGLVLLAASIDGILLRAPMAVRRAVHFSLPPIPDAFRCVEGLANGLWPVALGHLAHVTIYVTGCLLAAQSLQRIRAPNYHSQ